MIRINIFLAITLFGIIFIICPFLTLILIKNKTILKKISIVYFVVYLIFLSFLVFGEVYLINNEFSISLVKDATWFSLDFCIASFAKSNIAYNLVMFLPLGAFFLGIFKKNILLKTIRLSFLLSLTIELLQFILPVSRTTELFDLVTNTISGVCGYVIFSSLTFFFEKIKTKRKKQEKQ